MNYGLIPTDVFPGSGLVPGDGPLDSSWFFLGEAPGCGEDRAGRPFIGLSGKLLSKLLEYYTDLRRSGIYVTNVVKHRPPDNRTPKVAEVRKYLPFLYEELAEVNPRVVVACGATAAKVFDKGIKVTDDHGVARYVEIPNVWFGILVPWFHPAYALRNPAAFEALAMDAGRLHAEVERLEGPTLETDYSLVDEAEVVEFLLAHWQPFGFDTETMSPTHGKVFATDEADMVGYSVRVRPGQGWYVAAEHVGEGMAAILESPLWTKICHNAKFELKILRKQGVEIRGYEDTKLAAYLLGEPRTGLKTLVKQHLGILPVTYEQVTGGVDMSELPPEDIYEYAAADADHTLRLWGLFPQRLDAEGLRKVYEDIEKPLISTLARMENIGMNVDVDACQDASRRLRLALTESEIAVVTAMQDAGVETGGFNINSGDQLADILEALDAPLKKRTKSKRRYVVDADALDSIRAWNAGIIEPLLDYRKYAKMQTYVENFVQLRGPDGRLHTSFNQSGHWEEAGGAAGSAPSTGRVSSSGPNLQNIPHHRARIGDVDWGQVLRRCLVASDNQVLMSADLGQEEPRIIAVVANDRTLADGFQDGRDIYRPATEALYPSTVFDGTDAEFKREFEYERFVGKTFFLAWYYGAGGGRLRTLDESLGPKDVARGLSLLSGAHPARAAYLEETRALLEADGFVTTLYGRKRWISKAWSRNKKDREEALREAANSRIQGTAADILKIALAKIDAALTKAGLCGRLVLTVHDDVVIDLPQSEVTRANEIVCREFRGLLPGLALEVETYVGATWGERERIC